MPAKRHHGVQQDQRLVWKHCPDKAGWPHDLFQSEYWSWHSLKLMPHFKVILNKNTDLVLWNCALWQILPGGEETCQRTILWSANIILGYEGKIRLQVGSKGLRSGTLSYLIWFLNLGTSTRTSLPLPLSWWVWHSRWRILGQFKRKGAPWHQRYSSEISMV